MNTLSNHTEFNLDKYRDLQEQLGFLQNESSLEQMKVLSGSDFGRTIEKSVREMNNEGLPTCLKIRTKKQAVVVPLKLYETLNEMLLSFSELINETQKMEEEMQIKEFDQLFIDITSEKSLLAADSLFEVSDEELALSYKPGKTENTKV